MRADHNSDAGRMPPGAHMAIYIRNVLSAIRIVRNVTLPISIVQPKSPATTQGYCSSRTLSHPGISRTWKNFYRHGEVRCSWWKAHSIVACLKADTDRDKLVADSGVLFHLRSDA